MKNKDNKENKSFKERFVRWIVLILIAIVLANAVIIVFLYPLMEKDLYGTHHVPDTDYEYSKWKERDGEYDGIKFTKIYHTGENHDTEDYLTFYKFKTKRSAKKVFNKLKEDGYDSIEEGENYFIGWEKGVDDAVVKDIVALDGKIIVFADIYVASAWAMREDEEPKVYEFTERREYVMKNYVR